jgi:hypothetical protein
MNLELLAAASYGIANSAIASLVVAGMVRGIAERLRRV